MTDDPEALTQFILCCRERGVGAEALLELLLLVTRSENEGSSGSPLARASGYDPTRARYALLLALGEFTLEEIPAGRRDALLAQLADWYAHDPSSGVHGAAGWLLRRWGQADVARQVDQTPVGYSPDREWFTLAITVTPTAPQEPSEGSAEENPGSEPPPQKTFYYTFIVFPAEEYRIGSFEDELHRVKNEARHTARLTRPFAVLEREITFEELITFSPVYTDLMHQYDAGPADAGYAVDWYDSVRYCRWLGEQAGLAEDDQSYGSPDSLDAELYPRDANPLANGAPRNWPVDLGRGGFRLPTEAEWEAAARAGARTQYGHGGDASLLGRFGWFVENSGKHVHPPRQLRPGVRGLFDLHGNLFEWTHDWYAGDYGWETVTDPLYSMGGSLRLYRGGSWGNGAANCRAADRITGAPTYRTVYLGFRLALSPVDESQMP